MPDAFTTITNLLNSPPGQLVAGGVIAGIVWKFFERVEAVLNDDTKLEIAVWLLGVKVNPTIYGVPVGYFRAVSSPFRQLMWTTFATACGCLIFVFGSLNPSLPSGFNLHRIALLDTVVFLICAMVAVTTLNVLRHSVRSRREIRFRELSKIVVNDIGFVFLMVFSFFLIEVLMQASVVSWRAWVTSSVHSLLKITPSVGYTALAASFWLWLYAGSGFLLKAAKRFDIGFQWFNRTFDIEKKPLSSIGLVSGALVAVLYWGVAIGAHLLK